ncbi:hypothetical protein EB796_002385 [Bugula neritina]|uniref:Secreted protein n=1 Tax=Bugula neritina TaxID=10212 RepID=A0A7J7KME1_BUGNE|nr:hypothetical protein EB796_002385 [Bugula neritina]
MLAFTWVVLLSLIACNVIFWQAGRLGTCSPVSSSIANNTAANVELGQQLQIKAKVISRVKRGDDDDDQEIFGTHGFCRIVQHTSCSLFRRKRSEDDKKVYVCTPYVNEKSAAGAMKVGNGVGGVSCYPRAMIVCGE